MSLLRAFSLCGLLCFSASAAAQSSFGDSLGDFADYDQTQRDARNAVRDAEHDAGRGALDMGTGMAGWGLDTVASARDLRDAFDALDTGDNQYDPDALDGDGPTVPSQCAESPECNACYERAVGEIDFNRFYMGRAWSITRSTIDMAKKAEAFGDSASGIHGVSGLSWQLGGKPQIEESLRSLRSTYRNKYEAYIGNLETALQDLGQCEAEHFDERDWYGRFGFLYLNFMKAKYESPEP